MAKRTPAEILGYVVMRAQQIEDAHGFEERDYRNNGAAWRVLSDETQATYETLMDVVDQFDGGSFNRPDPLVTKAYQIAAGRVAR